MNTLFTTTYTSPLGLLHLAATHEGVCMVEFDVPERIAAHQAYFVSQGYTIVTESNPHLEEMQQQLNAYFAHECTQFSVPLDLKGTPFQCKVWQSLLSVPFGATRSYLEQAKALGDVKAIRAVATANGANRVAIVVPCHRILGSKGELTGYSGGVHHKRFLLEHESSQSRLF